jgi:hypothetical protein
MMGTLLAALWRRRIMTLVAVLLALTAGVGMALRGGPTYSYSATVLLLPPEGARHVSPGQPDYSGGNPLFFLGSLGQSRDILVGAMMTRDFQNEITAKFPGTKFAVTADILHSAPVVVITSSGPVDESASALVAALVERVPATLATLQEGLGINPSSRVTSHLLTSDRTPEISHKDQIRSGIMVIGALSLVFVFLIGAVDALLGGRRRTRAAKTELNVAGASTATLVIDKAARGEPDTGHREARTVEPAKQVRTAALGRRRRPVYLEPAPDADTEDDRRDGTRAAGS